MIIAIFEKLTDKLTRLTCFTESEWQSQRYRFTQLINNRPIRIEHLSTKEDAKSLIISEIGSPFKEYISTTNINELIIEQLI